MYFSSCRIPHRKKDWEDQGVAYMELGDLLSNNEILIVCTPTNVVVLNEAEFDKLQPANILVQACAATTFDKPTFGNSNPSSSAWTSLVVKNVGGASSLGF
jgi:hypothetical protein